MTINKNTLIYLLFALLFAASIFSSCSRKVFKQKTETKSDSTKVVKVDSVVKKKSSNTTYKRVTKKLKKSIEVDLDTTRYSGSDTGYWDVNTAQDYITEVGDTKIKTRQPVSKIILKSSDDNDSILWAKNKFAENVNLKKSDSSNKKQTVKEVDKKKDSSPPIWLYILGLVAVIVSIVMLYDNGYLNWLILLFKRKKQ